jgi:hypothetical protein
VKPTAKPASWQLNLGLLNQASIMIPGDKQIELARASVELLIETARGSVELTFALCDRQSSNNRPCNTTSTGRITCW